MVVQDGSVHTDLENLENLELTGNSEKPNKVREFRQRPGHFRISQGIFSLKPVLCFHTDIWPFRSGPRAFQRHCFS